MSCDGAVFKATKDIVLCDERRLMTRASKGVKHKEFKEYNIYCENCVHAHAVQEYLILYYFAS